MKRFFKSLWVRLVACYKILRYKNFDLSILGHDSENMKQFKFHSKGGYSRMFEQNIHLN
jgi:hypothetical protein